jgi:hypothetical protein
MTMISGLEIVAGLVVWFLVLRDGFETVVLPRTVTPMKRMSGRFFRRSWLLWAAVGRRIPTSKLRLSFLSIYGPLSVMVLLLIWAVVMLIAFAIIYHGLGLRFQNDRGALGFGALLYLSGSTFLTLGLGDITSADPVARFFMILEAGTGFIFLGLMISYMPVLHQAYGSREVGSMLFRTRIGHPPGAINLLARYSGGEGSEILRGNLRDAEHWMATTLQSHLCHPALAFYRPQHSDEAWLVSLATLLDTSALLVVAGGGVLQAQAAATHRMGLQLLKDLTDALGIPVESESRIRLADSDLVALSRAMMESRLSWTLGAKESSELLPLVRQYEIYLVALSDWLVIPLPSWVSAIDRDRAAHGIEGLCAREM